MRELRTKEEIDEVLADDTQYLTLIWECASGIVKMWDLKKMWQMSEENASLFLKDLGKDHAKFIATDINF